MLLLGSDVGLSWWASSVLAQAVSSLVAHPLPPWGGLALPSVQGRQISPGVAAQIKKCTKTLHLLVCNAAENELWKDLGKAHVCAPKVGFCCDC